jgi:uncharacterized membrane protein
MLLTPTDLVHLHLLLNHFPTVGLIVGFGIYLLALLKKSEDLKRGGLAVLFVIALIALPTYMTGYSALKALKNTPGVSVALIDIHQRSALLGLILLEATGIVAWYGLWRSRRRTSAGAGNTAAILLLSVLTLGQMASASNVGGQIRHPEILANPGVTATGGVIAPAWLASDFVKNYQYDHPWAWKTLETIHFMGLSLLFGVVLVANLRLLGMMRTAPLDGFHRLLPWGVWGFVANSVTGMMFFIGQSFQYIENLAFHLKIICILLAGLDVLYLTWHDEVWEMGPGDTAPATIKALAASQIVLWIGVIYFGRMLPYIGDAF